MILVNNAVVPCNGVLIDFDGTLVDSESALLGLWIDICASRQLSKDPTEVAYLVRGRPATRIIVDLVPDLSDGEQRQVLEALERKEEVAPYELMAGAKKFVVDAKRAELSLGIVTTSWREKVRNVTDRYSI